MFDTGKTDQNNAEKVMLECCEYEKVGVSCIQNIFKPLKLNSSEVMGLVPNELCVLSMGDTLTTQLITKNGFICQLLPYPWGDTLNLGSIIFIITEDIYYPVRVINSYLDI